MRKIHTNDQIVFSFSTRNAIGELQSADEEPAVAIYVDGAPDTEAVEVAVSNVGAGLYFGDFVAPQGWTMGFPGAAITAIIEAKVDGVTDKRMESLGIVRQDVVHFMGERPVAATMQDLLTGTLIELAEEGPNVFLASFDVNPFLGGIIPAESEQGLMIVVYAGTGIQVHRLLLATLGIVPNQGAVHIDAEDLSDIPLPCPFAVFAVPKQLEAISELEPTETQPRVNEPAGDAFTRQLSRRADGTLRAYPDVYIGPSEYDIAIALEFKPVMGSVFVKNVGTPTVTPSGQLTCVELGPRDTQAMVTLTGGQVSNTTYTIGVPVEMRTGENLAAVFVVRARSN